MGKLTNFLKQADIFYEVTAAQLEMISNICEERTYFQGEIILEEGTNSKDLYILTQGEVEILVNPALVGGPQTPQGKITITTLQSGQSFGEIALVDEGLRSATVRASQDDTRLLIVPREKLLRLCDTHSELGYRLMYNLAADLAMKIRNTDLRFRATLLYGKK